MTTKINHEYKIGDQVFLVSDTEQVARKVLKIIVLPAGVIMYSIRIDAAEVDVYEAELTADKNVI